MLTVVEKKRKEISVPYGLPELTLDVESTVFLTPNLWGSKRNNIELNRKVLADLAMNHPEAFKAVVDRSKIINNFCYQYRNSRFFWEFFYIFMPLKN